MRPDLPRLLYVGDVSVEASAGGSALVHRLLSDYPAERLFLAESHSGIGAPRLAGVARLQLDLGVAGWLPRRWPRLRNTTLFLRSNALATHLLAQTRKFAAEAVLTVSHQLSWVIATTVADKLDVPLHLINHDWWFDTFTLPGPLWPLAKERFGRTYRAAASRFCVSPYMAQYYESLYGARGSVLYPSRSAATPRFEAPPNTAPTGKFTIAYAGSMYHQYAQTLVSLAHALTELSGELIIHSSVPAPMAKEWGLGAVNVQVRPMLPPAILVEQLRSEAHALVLVLSDWGVNSRICFPSKLTEYTATGLPILVLAGRDSSAGRWVLENPGVALLVEEPSPAALREAVARLKNNADFRRTLGARALEVGDAQFGYESVRDKFFAALSGDSADGIAPPDSACKSR